MRHVLSYRWFLHYLRELKPFFLECFDLRCLGCVSALPTGIETHKGVSTGCKSQFVSALPTGIETISPLIFLSVAVGFVSALPMGIETFCRSR